MDTVRNTFNSNTNSINNINNNNNNNNNNDNQNKFVNYPQLHISKLNYSVFTFKIHKCKAN